MYRSYSTSADKWLPEIIEIAPWIILFVIGF